MSDRTVRVEVLTPDTVRLRGLSPEQLVEALRTGPAAVVVTDDR